jgi:hypothetical protein
VSRRTEIYNAWLVAFTATLYNKIFTGYQPCQLVKRRKNRRLKDHLLSSSSGTDVSYGTDRFSRHISTLNTRTEMVLETSVFSPFSQLTRLVARDYFVKYVNWNGRAPVWVQDWLLRRPVQECLVPHTVNAIALKRHRISKKSIRHSQSMYQSTTCLKYDALWILHPSSKFVILRQHLQASNLICA